jgi:hypothetical protein
MTSLKTIIKLKKATERIIKRRMFYVAGLRLVPIPVLKVAAIFSTQVLMILEIANLFNIPFNKHRIEFFVGLRKDYYRHLLGKGNGYSWFRWFAKRNCLAFENGGQL